jgi:hypothetical protein
MRCEVADESVVVMKSRPEKAGNSLEEKIGMTCSTLSAGDSRRQKPCCLRREEVYSMISLSVQDDIAEHKLSDGTGHFVRGMVWKHDALGLGRSAE